MKIKALHVQGPFTEAELAEVNAVVRAIERQHPDQTYYVQADTDDAQDAAEESLRRVFPQLPGYAPVIQTASLAEVPLSFEQEKIVARAVRLRIAGQLQAVVTLLEDKTAIDAGIHYLTPPEIAAIRTALGLVGHTKHVLEILATTE